jgi:hypothetical protein
LRSSIQTQSRSLRPLNTFHSDCGLLRGPDFKLRCSPYFYTAALLA